VIGSGEETRCPGTPIARRSPNPLFLPRYDGSVPQAVQPCPVEEAIKVIGGKWKLLVLRSLLLNGPQRYSELVHSVTAISQKELTRNLRELAEARLLATDIPDKRKARYCLTPLGTGLMPIFESMLTWGRQMQTARS
jgi:DNA-binding HxlR family transcriptional regulator